MKNPFVILSQKDFLFVVKFNCKVAIDLLIKCVSAYIAMKNKS